MEQKQENRGGKREGAGRKKGNCYNKYVWTDPSTHEVISELVKARKENTVTEHDLKELCSKIKEIQDRNLEQLTNEIIGKK